MTNEPSLMSRVGAYAFGWGSEPGDADRLVDLARTADDAGLHSLHMPWHLTLDPTSYGWSNRSYLEPLATLPFLASQTRQLRLGLTPFSPAVMHPYFWARYLHSLSRLSGGRALGLLRPSHVGDDYRIGLSPEDPGRERYTEGAAILRSLWAGEELSEAGHWDVEALSLGFDAPPVPLWIGGQADSDVELAARYGDVIRPGITTAQEALNLRARLDEACSSTGRNVEIATTMICVVTSESDTPEWLRENVEKPLEIRRARQKQLGGTGNAVVGSAEYCAERIQDLLDAGVSYLLLDTQFHGWQSVAFSIEQIGRLATDVAPLVRVPNAGRA